MKIFFIYSLIAMMALSCCTGKKENNIIIFHAGSLSVPVRKLNEAFEKDNPGVRILSEAAGSLVCARKVTELGKPCDIFLSADYSVIDKMLIPRYASWNIRFATNEIVIAYRQVAPYSSIIREDNWSDILLRKDVIYGRADPDADPCGYRTVFAAKLAENYYGRPGLADSLLNKDRDYIRPKEADLVALIEAGVIDYMFQYRSVAIQHGLNFLEFPDEINLSSPGMTELYSTVSYMIPGDKPGNRTEIKGDYISYSGTVLNNAPQKALAIRYFKFLLSAEGIRILNESGQEPLIPAVTDKHEALPPALQYPARGEGDN
jgi:molybdate/tungstate transport system substrate-binding protein